MVSNVLEQFLDVEMPDMSTWRVPVSVVAKHRARYYADHDGMSFQNSLYNDTLPLFESDPYEIVDWASNNMDWGDVAEHAQQIFFDDSLPDYQEGWVNGEKTVVDKNGKTLMNNA